MANKNTFICIRTFLICIHSIHFIIGFHFGINNKFILELLYLLKSCKTLNQFNKLITISELIESIFNSNYYERIIFCTEDFKKICQYNFIMSDMF